MKVLLAWSGLLALWTLAMLVFSPEPIIVALLGGAALAVAAGALVARSARAGAAPPDLSFATVLVALGVAALLSGTELGTWCIGLGALLTAAGIAGLIAERRAPR